MGDKIFINFNKYPFEKCIELVFKEINLSINQINKDSDNAKSVPTKSSATRSFSKPTENNETADISVILKWSEKQVEDWFNENKLGSSIFLIIKPCDGELLHQLYTLLLTAPEFFYQSLSKNNSVDLRTALVFSLNLKKLFENQK